MCPLPVDPEEPIQVARHVLQMHPYSPGRPIEDVQREYGLTDIIKLASNENPLGPSPRTIAAMQEACAGVGLYPDDSCYTLRNALARHLELDPSLLIFGNGSDEIIHSLGLAFLEPGDEVVFADPTFSRYGATAVLGQSLSINVPLKNHTHDLDALAAACTERTRLVFVSNPNNPTGTMNTKDEVERLLERIPPRAVVVFDEAYFEYVEDPAYPDSTQYVREGRNVVVLRTFSKLYALAGLRVGYGFARKTLIDYLNQVRNPFNVNIVAQAGAVAALSDPDQMSRSLEVNRSGKEYLYRCFREMGLNYIPTVANFIAVDMALPAREVCAGLERRGVIVRSGEPFGIPTFIRVTIGTPSQCERFIEALKDVLASL